MEHSNNRGIDLILVFIAFWKCFFCCLLLNFIGEIVLTSATSFFARFLWDLVVYLKPKCIFNLIKNYGKRQKCFNHALGPGTWTWLMACLWALNHINCINCVRAASSRSISLFCYISLYLSICFYLYLYLYFCPYLKPYICLYFILYIYLDFWLYFRF